jgi:hypothetical protein
MALTTVLKDVAKVAGTGVPGAIYNGVTNGNWTDITPGYSAGAVLNTQFGSKPTACPRCPRQGNGPIWYRQWLE